VQLAAIDRVHARKGIWNTEGGFDTTPSCLRLRSRSRRTGPGRWSLDAARGRERRGLRWALAALAGGLAGAKAALALADRHRERASSADGRAQPAQAPPVAVGKP
jgi:putative oxidoreductase